MKWWLAAWSRELVQACGAVCQATGIKPIMHDAKEELQENFLESNTEIYYYFIIYLLKRIACYIAAVQVDLSRSR